MARILGAILMAATGVALAVTSWGIYWMIERLQLSAVTRFERITSEGRVFPWGLGLF
jgi:hypothetical protein